MTGGGAMPPGGGARGATATLAFDGTHYRIHIDSYPDGTTRIRFMSSRPPAGLHECLYEFNGRLPEISDEDEEADRVS